MNSLLFKNYLNELSRSQVPSTRKGGFGASAINSPSRPSTSICSMSDAAGGGDGQNNNGDGQNNNNGGGGGGGGDQNGSDNNSRDGGGGGAALSTGAIAKFCSSQPTIP